MEIARRLVTGRLIARDCDGESLELARERLGALSCRVTFDRGRFSTLRASLRRLGVERVDGLLADLGVSRFQLTSPERGFSFHSPVLDMRMSREEETTAADIVNFSSEKEIADLIYRYGEERRARRIASAIVRARPVSSTHSLASLIEQVVPRTSHLHPATRTLQALRIATNREMEEIESLLDAIPECVAPGGRVVTLSFHSGEDRLIKQRFAQWAKQGRAAAISKHVIQPGDEELKRNAAARSAKLRCIQMLEQPGVGR